VLAMMIITIVYISKLAAAVVEKKIIVEHRVRDPSEISDDSTLDALLIGGGSDRLKRERQFPNPQSHGGSASSSSSSSSSSTTGSRRNTPYDARWTQLWSQYGDMQREMIAKAKQGSLSGNHLISNVI